MAKARILFDKTELVVQIADDHAMSMNIQESDITAITIEESEIPGFLGLTKKKSEHIVIKTKKNPAMPVTVDKSAVKDDWESYKTNMEKFAHDNKLTFQKYC